MWIHINIHGPEEAFDLMSDL